MSGKFLGKVASLFLSEDIAEESQKTPIPPLLIASSLGEVGSLFLAEDMQDRRRRTLAREKRITKDAHGGFHRHSLLMIFFFFFILFLAVCPFHPLFSLILFLAVFVDVVWFFLSKNDY
ncbi:hypothetical protein Fmac_033037 [Flemingia macrophylla]|uniref:Uncharacterized protein n=1 Tax=Flemingia macrophylla TaxID=520843 RepID=A0ABD1L6N3_9FABA